MFNWDNITKKDDNKDWPYRKLIIGPSGSGKPNYLYIRYKKTTISSTKFICISKIWKNPSISF